MATVVDSTSSEFMIFTNNLKKVKQSLNVCVCLFFEESQFIGSTFPTNVHMQKIKVIFLLFQLEHVTTFSEGYTSFWVTIWSGNNGSLRA